MKYIHRDIKPANVLRYRSSNDIDYTYKIADFGLAVGFENSSDLTTLCGTKRFMAPEMDGARIYGPQVDVWSLGVLFFSLLVGKHAQVDATKEETYRPTKKDNLSPLFPRDLKIKEQTQELVISMLCNNPNRRCTVKEVEGRLTDGSLWARANRTADSGIASSCTSGSSSANGSGAGMTRYMNTYSSDKNNLPGLLESVTEEQTTIESGIDKYGYKRSVTPRNTFRAINSENVAAGNGPIKPTLTGNRYCTEMSKDLPFSPIPKYNPTSTNYISTPTTYSTTTVDSSYRNRQACIEKPARLNTLRLRPSTKEHKMNKGSYCITQDLGVKMELSIEKRSNNAREPSSIGILKEILFISSNGNEVIVTRNGVKSLETTYDDLPQKYWAKYNKAAEFVKSIKAFTPKITWLHDKATCKLMENGINTGDHIQADANFLVDFDSGIKFEYDASKSIVTISEKKDSTSNNDKSLNYRIIEKVPICDLHLIETKYTRWCNLFKYYHEETRKIDSLHEKLQANNTSHLQYFPLRMGHAKVLTTSSSSVSITSTYSHANIHNNENRNLLANQNRVYSTGELQKRAPFTGQHYMNSAGRYSPSLPHTRSTPIVAKYDNYSSR